MRPWRETLRSRERRTRALNLWTLGKKKVSVEGRGLLGTSTDWQMRAGLWKRMGSSHKQKARHSPDRRQQSRQFCWNWRCHGKTKLKIHMSAKAWSNRSLFRTANRMHGSKPCFGQKKSDGVGLLASPCGEHSEPWGLPEQREGSCAERQKQHPRGWGERSSDKWKTSNWGGHQRWGVKWFRVWIW